MCDIFIQKGAHVFFFCQCPLIMYQRTSFWYTNLNLEVLGPEDLCFFFMDRTCDSSSTVSDESDESVSVSDEDSDSSSKQHEKEAEEAGEVEVEVEDVSEGESDKEEEDVLDDDDDE